MTRVIEARVAAIIDDTRLVLNVGYDQGVSEGAVFVIFDAHADITDPVTGEPLGQWECVKARVVATHVQQRMTTVQAPVVREERVTDGTRPLSAMMVEHSLGHYGVRGEEWQQLNVRVADLSGRPRLQPIAVGDGARFVPEATEQEEPDPRDAGGADVGQNDPDPA